MDYNIYDGGPDLFARERPILVTDLLRGDQYEVMVVDFYIDEMLDGYVFFDGEIALQQKGIESYEVLERLFYSQFSIEM